MITVRAVATHNTLRKSYEDSASRADNIGNVRHRGSGSSTKVKDLRAGLHVNVLQATQDTGGDLASAVLG